MEVNNIISALSLPLLVDKGIKFALLDVDGTLLSNKDKLVSPEIKEWIIKAKEHLKLHLISNNPSRERIKLVAEQLDIDFTFSARKPSRKAILNIIRESGMSKDNFTIIGDKIFTDILSGNRVGIYTILVVPVEINSTNNIPNKYQKFEKAIIKILGGNTK